MLIRIRVPRPDSGVGDFARRVYVCRVDNVDDSLHRIAIQFAKPLPYKPAEKSTIQPEDQRKLEAATL